MSTESFKSPLLTFLQTEASGYPEVSEGASCVNRAFKARKKNFLFLGEKPESCRVMMKLGPSLEEARALLGRPSDGAAGETGWITLKFEPAEEPVPRQVLARWVEESYRLLAPKTLVKQLG